MNRNMQPAGYGYTDASTGISTQERNRVLRNTYWLLALSMVPTVLGAIIGNSMGMLSLLYGMGTIARLAIFFGGAFGLMFLIEKTKNSAMGVVFLMLFTFFMGLMMSPLITFTLGRYTNGAQLVATAFGGTAAIFFAMATLATVIKKDISSWGKFLSIGLMMAIAIGISNIFFQSGPLMMTVSALVMVISSVFLLYSVKSVIDGGETNYISATLSIYISLYNVFTTLLQLLGIFGGEE